MSIRHIDQLLDPSSVAVFGASERTGSVGATVWRNLSRGGFAGALWPVNPKHHQLGDHRCHAHVAALPAAPDLAVICTPAATVPGLIAELGARGTRAAVVLTAGLDTDAKSAMLQAARPHLLRILGPNCLGLLVPHIGLNASFAHLNAATGSLAFVSQSGALVTAMLDWAAGRGIGFSHCISLGEHADIDFADLLDWLAGCARTRAILMYIESVDGARKFMSAARAAARNKPVLVVKAGRSAFGQAAAASHTGALAAADIVFDAAIRRAGMLRVETLQDLFDAAETLAHFQGSVAADVARALREGEAEAPQPGSPRSSEGPPQDRLTLVTNGGGAGVLAADAAAQAGIDLAPLSDATRQALDAVLPPHWSRGNPVDLIGDAPVARYVQALLALLTDPRSGTLLFMHAPTAIVPSRDIAQALAPLLRDHADRVLACWLGGPGVAEARALFDGAGISCHDTPEAAVRAFARLVEYRRNQVNLMQVPRAPAAVRPVALGDAPTGQAESAGTSARHSAAGATQAGANTVSEVIERVLASRREMLTEPEAKSLLAACGVPVVPTRIVGPSALSAMQAACELGFPVVLKVLSPQISHKSDVGGVVLDLAHAQAVSDAVKAILARVAQARPDAVVEGFTVQPMVRRPRALELIVGAHIDPLFGPIILFGQGGTAVEVVADRAVGLPPLNDPLARALIARTRVARLLQGWRDVPPADLDAVVGVLTALSDLLAREPRIAEIDINPLLADAQGVVALDARVRVSAAAPGGAARFAIRPYPQELVRSLHWQGHELTVRPIRPEDEAQHRAFIDRLDAEDLRMRFFHSRRTIERGEMARLTQIDYEREMAFIATAPAPAPAPTPGSMPALAFEDTKEETLGVVRALCDPDNEQAEFALVVRSDLKGAGLGRLLMDRLIEHLRQRGTRRLVGEVLRDNRRMLALAHDMGFEAQTQPLEPATVRVTLPL